MTSLRRCCRPNRLLSALPFGIGEAADRGHCRSGCGCSSGVEHNLAKVGVEGSNPFARSSVLGRPHVRSSCLIVGVGMSRVGVGRLSKSFAKPSRPADGARHVARLFVPGYESGIVINVTLRLNRSNSDARRRLGRLIESRRVVS
jgi:hypothetical protein